MMIMNNPYSDIHEFVKDIGLRDIAFQREILDDDSKKVSVRLGRQMGSTTLITVRAIWDAIDKHETCVFIVVPSERQRQLINNEIFRYIVSVHKLNTMVYNVNNQIMSQNNYYSLRYGANALTIEFANNSQINIVVDDYGYSPGYQIDSLLIDEVDYIDEESISKYVQSQRTSSKILLCGTPSGRYPPGIFEQSFYSVMRDMEVYYEYSTHWYDYREGIRARLFNPKFAFAMLDRGVTIEGFLKDFGAMFPQEIKRELTRLNKRGLLKYFNRTFMRPHQRFKRWIREKLERMRK